MLLLSQQLFLEFALFLSLASNDVVIVIIAVADVAVFVGIVPSTIKLLFLLLPLESSELVAIF